MKKRTLISLILTFTLVLSMCLTSCQNEELTPSEYLSKAVEKTFNVGSSSSKVTPTLIDIAFKATPITESFGIQSLDLGILASDKGVSFDLAAIIFGAKADITAIGDGKSLAISSSILGEGTYGTDMENFEENYKNSVFADPESRYYMGDLSEMGSLDSTNLAQNEKIQSVVKRYYSIVSKSINDNAEFSMTENEDGGKTVTAVIDSSDLKAIVKAVYEVAKNDTELREAFVLMAETYGEELKGEMMDEYDALFADEDALEEILASIEEAPFTVSSTVITTSKDLISKVTVAIEVSEEGEKDVLTLVLDLTKENTAELNITSSSPLELGDGTYAESISLIIVSEEDDKSSNSSVSVKMDLPEGPAVEMEVFSLSYDKTSGAYELTLLRDIPEVGPITLKGTAKEEKDSLSLTLTSLEMAGTAVDLDIKVTVSESKEDVSVPQYTEAMKLTEDQIDAILENVMEHPLIAMFFGGY